jgi:hypothetical protein
LHGVTPFGPRKFDCVRGERSRRGDWHREVVQQ